MSRVPTYYHLSRGCHTADAALCYRLYIMAKDHFKLCYYRYMTKLYKIVRSKAPRKKQSLLSKKPKRNIKGVLSIIVAFLLILAILLIAGMFRKSAKISTFAECMNESGHRLVTSPSQPRKCFSKSGTFYTDESQLRRCSQYRWATTPQFCK